MFPKVLPASATPGRLTRKPNQDRMPSVLFLNNGRGRNSTFPWAFGKVSDSIWTKQRCNEDAKMHTVGFFWGGAGLTYVCVFYFFIQCPVIFRTNWFLLALCTCSSLLCFSTYFLLDTDDKSRFAPFVLEVVCCLIPSEFFLFHSAGLLSTCEKPD